MTGKTKGINIDFKPLGKFRFEITGAAIFILVTFVFFFIWRYNSAELARLEGSIAMKNSEVTRIEAEASTVKGLETAVQEASANLSQIQERLKAMNERLPSDRHISRLLADLSDSERGVRIVSIKPLAPEDRGSLARLPFQINMESRFVPFGAYVERIENLPRLMVIDNISIEPKEDGSNMLSSNLFLSAYVLGHGVGQ